MACKYISLGAITCGKCSYMLSVCMKNLVHSFHAVSIQVGDRLIWHVGQLSCVIQAVACY